MILKLLVVTSFAVIVQSEDYKFTCKNRNNEKGKSIGLWFSLDENHDVVNNKDFQFSCKKDCQCTVQNKDNIFNPIDTVIETTAKLLESAANEITNAMVAFKSAKKNNQNKYSLGEFGFESIDEKIAAFKKEEKKMNDSHKRLDNCQSNSVAFCKNYLVNEIDKQIDRAQVNIDESKDHTAFEIHRNIVRVSTERKKFLTDIKLEFEKEILKWTEEKIQMPEVYI
jgi:hypothetical protein